MGGWFSVFKGCQTLGCVRELSGLGDYRSEWLWSLMA